MRKKYIITYVTELLVLISGILVYKLAAHFLGNVGFSEYVLSRRAVTLIQPALLMGLGVGIPRYVAHSFRSPTKNSDFYYIGAVGILFLVVIASLSIMFLFRQNIAFLIFGSSKYTYLIFPMSLMLLGIISHMICYIYFQGKLFMIQANFLQIVNIAIVPLVVFLFSNNTVNILTLIGGFWFVSSMVSFFYILRQLEKPKLKSSVFPYARELFVYSIQRVPGDFGLAALLSLAAILTAHAAGVEQAGYVAFGISMLSAAGSFFAPIGIVLLPHASQMVADVEITRLKLYVKRILVASTSLAIIGVIVFIWFLDMVIEFYLGKSFLKISSIITLIAIGVVPYAIFISMRSILDSYYVKAVNTKNVLVSLAFLLVCYGVTLLLSVDYEYLVIEFVSSLFLLGILTLIDIRKIFRGNR